MATPLRVIHLEDNLIDRELVREALNSEEMVCEFIYATSESEFSTVLEHQTFGLILSDFTLPGYDGLSALAIAQRTCPAVPYVFISGTIGEQRAIESLRGGATDYVLKDHLERLLPVVRRALLEAGERAKRHAAEASLQRSEELFREMAERIDDVFYIATPGTGDWLYVSPAYDEIWGRSRAELYEQRNQWIEAIVPEDRARVLAARAQLADGGESHIEYRIQRSDGTSRWIEDRCYLIRDAAGKILRTVGVARDITQRQQLQGQLLQAQKMEAVGQLAGGLAHDFNNVLTIVIGYAQLLLDSGTMPGTAIEPLTQIFNAGNRAANLTRQLLVFSRKQTVHRRTLDLNEIADELGTMLRRLIGANITLDIAVAPVPCLIDADSGMIEQVLLNLTLNARDAMPEGGTLSIATEHVSLTAADSHRHPDARAGEFVCLGVRDTGCGIPAEILPRIFEPFFTTKAASQGTGLGLAMAFGIIREHQGWIELESTPGAGAHFRILLPALPRETVLPARNPIKTSPFKGGGETLLLVEDEPAVREFAVEVLRRQGYRVLQATSGVDALEVWKWHRERIALLVTDLVMPEGIGGVELAERLRTDKPTLRVVLASGYESATHGQEYPRPAGTHFIQKPYKPQALAQTVRDALDDQFHH